MLALLVCQAVVLWMGQKVDGHVHAPPHGGTIAHAGPYHLELLVEESWIEVWVLDARLKTVPPKDLSLRVTLEPKDREKQVLTLAPTGDRFRAAAKLEGFPDLVATAELATAKGIVRGVFRWTLLDARHRMDDSMSRKQQSERAPPTGR